MATSNVQTSTALKKYLIFNHMISPAVLNLVINGFVTWFIFKNAEVITFWGKSSISIDLLLTAFLLPFLTCVISSYTIAKDLDSGKVKNIIINVYKPIDCLLRPVYLRGFILGATVLIIIGFPTVLLLEKTWSIPLTLWKVVLFKALWAALVATAITPLIALWQIKNGTQR